MNDRPCTKLDDYLGGWLPKPAQADFEAHLARCAHCRAEVERQRRLDGMLGQVGARLEPVPPELVERIERRLAAAQWRSRATRAVAGLAAAAVLLLSVLLWPERPATETAGPVVEAPVSPHEATAPEPPTAPLDPRGASEQLAMLVVSRCGSSCPAAHRWTRVPAVAPPARLVHRAFSVTVLGNGEVEAQQAPEVQERPKMLLSSSTIGVSCIQARHTLGARRIARVVFD
jgi:hypothetical protein